MSGGIVRVAAFFVAWMPAAWLGRNYEIGLIVGSAVVLAFWRWSLRKQERLSLDELKRRYGRFEEDERGR